MKSDVIVLGLLAVLALSFLTAAYTDARWRKIYNWQTLPLAACAPLFWWASGFGLHDIGWQLLSAGGWFAVLCLINAAGMLGGGDLKLLTACALWVKPMPFMHLLMIMALVGGGLCVAIAVWKITIRSPLKPQVPYGLAIAVAGLWILGTDYLPMIHSALHMG